MRAMYRTQVVHNVCVFSHAPDKGLLLHHVRYIVYQGQDLRFPYLAVLAFIAFTMTPA